MYKVFPFSFDSPLVNVYSIPDLEIKISMKRENKQNLLWKFSRAFQRLEVEFSKRFSWKFSSWKVERADLC